MRHLAALTAFGLLASTAAYAQNAPQTQPQSSQNQNEATETQGAQQQALAQPFVRQIQMRLHAQGVFEGNPTGTWDEGTSKAVKDFQQAQNMQPTGQIDGRTLAALMRPASMEGEEGEGSSTPPTARGGMSMLGMRMPVVRSFERGYQQGFEEGLRWAQEQEQSQEQR